MVHAKLHGAATSWRVAAVDRPTNTVTLSSRQSWLDLT
jgi:hypothetical protein